MANGLDQAVLEPHLTDVVRAGSRYPNPFFDLAQQYTPRTIKELFQWCTFFFYTNPLVGATITKISRYPITDIVIDDPETKVTTLWTEFFEDDLKIKDRHMEINLDLNVYGNAFVSVHLPFIRYLICRECNNRSEIKETKWKWVDYKFHYNCPKCKAATYGDPGDESTIKDVPYRSKEEIKLIRWNPENIMIKHVEATGKTVYHYVLNSVLKHQINLGDRDILEDIPLLFIQAAKKNRVIKLSNKNIYHLKRPTLAEKDMGWGKPLVYHVMKDLYYMATLRKAQEAVANEHIVPFDFLFPQPNAQMDPFVHSDLGNWKSRVEEQIKKHRWDPNYKAILPVPIGFGRLGGDGKALMLTPELNYLNQTVVGGMGIPQEFLFGGLNWTGSSVTLRSLQNDFMHNQTQLLDLTKWVQRKVALFLKYPMPKETRFLDFKMADDIQRIQQLIGLNAQRKVSDDTLLTELGLDYEKETKKIISEIQTQNKIQDIVSKSQAKSSGEAQLIQYNYQQKLQELQQRLDSKNQAQINYGGPQAGNPFGAAETGLQPQNEQLSDTSHAGMGADQAVLQPGYQDQTGQQMPGATPAVSDGGQTNYLDVHKMVKSWATKLSNMEPTQQRTMLSQIKQQMPAFGDQVEKAMNQVIAESGGGAGSSNSGNADTKGQVTTGHLVNMNPMPEQKAPTRKGAV